MPKGVYPKTPEMYESRRGRKKSEETRKKMSIAGFKRRPCSEETRRKLSNLMKRVWSSPEARERIQTSRIEFLARPGVREKISEQSRLPIGSKWQGRYIRIKIGEPDKWEYEHRVVMERKLGRKLNSLEFVHHINGNSTDNNPENLEIMRNGQHMAHHHSLRRSFKTKVNI